MTCKERERWLIEGAYEQTADGWVARSDRAGDETAQQVVQAVTTMSGVGTVVAEIFHEVVEPTLDDSDEHVENLWAWYAAVGILLLVIVVAALLTDMFGTRGGSDAEPPVSDQAVENQVVAAQAVEGQGAEDQSAESQVVEPVDPPAVADEPVLDEQPAAPDPATITFSSLPAHVVYAKT